MAIPRAQPGGTAAVLVVADVHDELTPLVQTLKTAVAPLEVTTDEDHALSILARGEPHVLGLAHSRLELSLAFYLHALKRSPTEASHLQTILFCNRAEAGRAYDLCRDSVVDDYLVIRPIYDTWQLALAVKHARDRLTVRRWMLDVTTPPPEQKNLPECVADLEAAVATHAPGHARLERALAAVRGAVTELTGHLEHGARLVEESRARRNATGLASVPEGPMPLANSMQPSLATILVVDDDDLSRRLVSRSLESGGYRVLTAEDGAQGMAALQAEHVDLVLMDVEMPGLSGFDVTKRVRERWSELPIIMLTGHGEQQTVIAAMEAGASDFVVKPGTRAGLLAKVAHSLRGSANGDV
jgi:CheY-like chemotaxis protein